jgi:phosphatidylglycerol lysyltransferase
MRRCLAVPRAAPFTLGLLVALWVVGLTTGSITHGPDPALAARVGLGVQPLMQGRWAAPLTSLLWCGDLAGYLVTTVLLLAVCAPVEWRLGSLRTAFFFVASHIMGGLGAVLLVTTGSLAGEWWSASMNDAIAVGPSTGIFGVLLAVSWRLPPLWRRRLRLVGLITLAMLVLYSGQLQDVVRLGAGLAGLLVGWLLPGPETARRPGAPSRPEARLLLALITCASAVGPLIAAVSGTEVGPLSSLRYVFLPAVPDPEQIAEVCADPTQAATCHAMQAQVVMHGFAPAFAAVIPVLLLIVLAEGLRRGRRSAWWGVVIVNIMLTVFGVISQEVLSSVATSLLTGPQSYQDLERLVDLIAVAVQPLVVVGLLIAHRRAFDVAAPPRTYRRLGVAAGALLAALSLAYVGGGRLVAGQFAKPPDVGQLLVDLPLRFIPPGYLDGAAPRLEPVGPLATLLYGWTGVVFWTVVLLGAWTAFRRSQGHTGIADATRARGLLVRHGGSQLSYMTTWRGNHYWFSPDGRAVVTYRLVASVALTVGDPVGDPAAVSAAVRGFAQFCAANGWTPCFYSVTEELSATLEPIGWNLLQIAEDTRLPLAQLKFTGRKWQDVRTAINRAKRDAITAEWHPYRHAPADIAEQIRAISAEWVLDKGIPEMGFTLGGLAELGDDAVRCLIAIDADRTVLAVTSWLPVYAGGEVVGWTLDMMRRGRRCGNGIMEFLIATAASQFKAEGAQFLSLSGAPLARHDKHRDRTGLPRLLDGIGRALEPVYGFNSLLAFKAKFQPVYRPLYLAYPDSAALPSIAGAIARAYLPALTPRQALRLAGLTLRHVRWPEPAARPELAVAEVAVPELALPELMPTPDFRSG